MYFTPVLSLKLPPADRRDRVLPCMTACPANGAAIAQGQPVVSSPPSQVRPLALLRGWRRSRGRRGKPVPPPARDPTALAPAGVCPPKGESLSRSRGPEPAGRPSSLHRTPRRHPWAPACRQFRSGLHTLPPPRGLESSSQSPRRNMAGSRRCLDSGAFSPLRTNGRCGPARLS